MDSSIFSPPDDIISEILSRTCIQTLGRCRLVSKQWNQTTYTSNFLDQFLKRTNTVSGFFIQGIKNNNYTSDFVPVDKPCLKETNLSLNFLPYPVKILAADNKQGILLCENRTRNHKIPRYCICKPATKQWRTMPNPKTRYYTRATAIMVLGSEPLRFKIVRFSERKSAHIMYKCEIYYNVRCEIFDSETWAWKEENDIRLPYGVYFSNSNHPSVASACGKLYWLLSGNQIFVFDLNNESWKIFSLPKSLCEKDIHHQLVEYEGRLGLVSMGKDEDCLELWVMKEFGKIKVWGKRLEISMEDIREREYHTCPTAFCNADVAIFKGFSRMMFYNFQNHKNSKDVPLELPFLYARDVFSLQSDFEDANFCWN